MIRAESHCVYYHALPFESIPISVGKCLSPSKKKLHGIRGALHISQAIADVRRPFASFCLADGRQASDSFIHK